MILWLDQLLSVRSACEMETDNNVGFHTVFPEGNITLTCDSDDAISVSWIRASDDVNVANGTTLTIVGVVGTEIYSCRVWGPDCNVQLSSSVAPKSFGKIPVIFNHVLISLTRSELVHWFRMNFDVGNIQKFWVWSQHRTNECNFNMTSIGTTAKIKYTIILLLIYGDKLFLKSSAD